MTLARRCARQKEFDGREFFSRERYVEPLFGLLCHCRRLRSSKRYIRRSKRVNNKRASRAPNAPEETITRDLAFSAGSTNARHYESRRFQKEFWNRSILSHLPLPRPLPTCQKSTLQARCASYFPRLRVTRDVALSKFVHTRRSTAKIVGIGAAGFRKWLFTVEFTRPENNVLNLRDDFLVEDWPSKRSRCDRLYVTFSLRSPPLDHTLLKWIRKNVSKLIDKRTIASISNGTLNNEHRLFQWEYSHFTAPSCTLLILTSVSEIPLQDLHWEKDAWKLFVACKFY